MTRDASPPAPTPTLLSSPPSSPLPPRLRLLTWNLQWCCGMDGRVDPARIIDLVRGYGGVDVLCFQEVARNYPALRGSAGEDQFALLAEACPGFETVEAIGTDVRAPDGRRRQFGNLILSRWPILQARRLQLPWPGDPDHASMPRALAEAVIDTPIGPISIMTTHVEYYSLIQRRAQAEALRQLHAETLGRQADHTRERHRGGPFEQAARARSVVLCGDFNWRPDAPEHAVLGTPVEGSEGLLDAWALANPGRAHPPTLGCHDPAPREAAYCCDYVFVSECLAPRVRSLVVDPLTQASDHQPLLLELDLTGAEAGAGLEGAAQRPV